MVRAMEALTLYVDAFYISPYAMTAFVALEEKGLEYEVRGVALQRGEQRQPGFPAFTGRVPALTHGEYVLSESMAIAEYLAEMFPYPSKSPRMLFPPDFRDRGICREVMGWVRSDLMPIREERSTHTVFYAPTDAPLSEAGERAVAKLLRACDRLSREDRTTLFSEWCIADADLAMMLQRLNANGHPLPAKVKAYVEANWQRPSVRKWWDRTRPPYEPY